MANERYEGVGLNGHYTLAERIFTKIKGLFDTKVKTDVPANAVFTDEKVKQNETTSEAQYEILFSGTADNVTRTEETRKHSKLLYNPYSQTLTVGTKEDPYARGVITLRGGTDSPAYLGVDGIISVIDSDMGCLFVKPNDIELFSSVDPSYTWDGVNTSLKDALSAIEDTKVTQTELSADEVREILIAGTSTTATITTGAAKSVGLRIHPNAKAIMEGDNTLATTFSSHAEGAGSTASGMYSHAEGYYTRANGQGTHVEGYQNFSTTATAYGGHAEGFCTTINSGPGAHAEGFHTYADGLGSHAEGYYTTAKGNFPHAEGNYVYASGDGSHAEGYKTTAKAYQSHAEGNYTYANNNFTHVEGNYSTGNGYYSHSEGDHSISSGVASHTEGCYTNATTTGAHAEGYGTSAKYNVAGGVGSHAEGFGTCASGLYSHAEGSNTQASGDYSHAEGHNSTASSIYSHAEGFLTLVSGERAHVEGNESTASGHYSHAEGSQTLSSSTFAHSEGANTVASGSAAHAEGGWSIASGNSSHAEGGYTKASGIYTHAEGTRTTALGNDSHAEGYGAYALGQHTHAEGYGTTASGSTSHSEGYNTRASGAYSHVEGFSSSAAGNYAHAEGYKNIANGEAAHAEGSNTSAPGYYSHTEGYKTVALNKSQHVFGEFNILDNDPYQVMSDERGKWVEIVGNGNSVTRSNARTLDWDGNEKIAGNLTDKWGLQTSRTMFEEDFQQLTQAERDNGTTYYIPDREPLKICDYIYPVGAIYMSVNNISPAILFGGTWERIKDRFLLAAGDDYNAGSTGGEAEHTLSIDEMPLHDHSLIARYPLNFKDGIVQANTTSNWKGGLQWNTGVAAKTNTTGSNQPHNNMPPYLTVYMWKRVPDPVQQEEEEGE